MTWRVYNLLHRNIWWFVSWIRLVFGNRRIVNKAKWNQNHERSAVSICVNDQVHINYVNCTCALIYSNFSTQHQEFHERKKQHTKSAFPLVSVLEWITLASGLHSDNYTAIKEWSDKAKYQRNYWSEFQATSSEWAMTHSSCIDIVKYSRIYWNLWMKHLARFKVKETAERSNTWWLRRHNDHRQSKNQIQC